MDADRYQREALRTERTPPFVATGGGISATDALRLGRTIHGLLGIGTEMGEAMDMVKKHLIYDRAYDEINMLEEMGDVLWYVALVLQANGFTFTQAMERNLAKLEARYGGEFSPEKANKRDLGKERAILESKDPNGPVSHLPKSCNLHSDCNEADDDCWRSHEKLANHCHDDTCEDCLGR